MSHATQGLGKQLIEVNICKAISNVKPANNQHYTIT